jgi:hypothetical protein
MRRAAGIRAAGGGEAAAAWGVDDHGGAKEPVRVALTLGAAIAAGRLSERTTMSSSPIRVVVASAVLLLAPFARAQFVPGMPIVPPPMPHPSLGVQMGMGAVPPSSPAGCGAPAGSASKPMPPETTGVQVAGKELKKAVAKVTALHWFDDLAAAKARSAATGKPILWLQSLGDLEGFA